MVVMGTIDRALVADKFLASFTIVDKRILVMDAVAE